MQKNSKIYVAGHYGMVGSAIVRKLSALGYNNLIFRTHDELDLIDQVKVHAFFANEKPQYVFLAAAKVGGINANNKYRADFIYQNLQIQNNIIHASFLHNVIKLLFLGSSCIYPKNAPQPLKEESLLTGELEYTNEPYAIAKIAGIKLCESYNLQHGTNYVAVMPTNLYGNNDNFDLEKSHVLPAMIRKFYLARLLDLSDYQRISSNLGIENNLEQITEVLLQNGIYKDKDGNTTIELWGTGRVYREFLHVDDMADACVFVMDKIDFSDLCLAQNEIRNTQINIGCGHDIMLNQLAQIIAREIGFWGKVKFDSAKPDGTSRKLQDVNKLKMLGWQAQIDLEVGIKQVINWYIATYG